MRVFHTIRISSLKCCHKAIRRVQITLSVPWDVSEGTAVTMNNPDHLQLHQGVHDIRILQNGFPSPKSELVLRPPLSAIENSACLRQRTDRPNEDTFYGSITVAPLQLSRLE